MTYANIHKLLEQHYQEVSDLNRAFDTTHQKPWTPLIILNELSVQVGQIYNIFYPNPATDEPGRPFTNLGESCGCGDAANCAR